MEDGKKKCIGKYGCGEEKPLKDFAKNTSTCKVCWNKRARVLAENRMEKRLGLEKGKIRTISEENRTFFKLGVLKGEEGLNDVKKALMIQEKANRALLEVIRDADQRDSKTRIGE